MRASIELVGTQGYAATTISDLLARAGVSRKAFYRHFDDKRECLLAAYDAIVAEGVERVSDASAGARGMRDDPAAGLEALLDHVIENPRVPRLAFVEIRATGPEGIARREQLVGAYERLLRRGLELTPGRGIIPNPLARAYVGGILRVLSTRAPNPRALRPLLPELIRLSGSYYPAPAAVKAALCDPRPLPARVGLAGGRAPGTLRPASGSGIAPRKAARRARGMSRSFVIHSQRERILDAVTNLAAAKGYASLSLEQIVEESCLSMNVFYEHFAGKEDAFLVAHEVGQAKARAITERALASASDWPTGVHAGITAQLQFLASEPAFARVALVEALIANARSAKRANLAIGAFAQMLAPSLEPSGDGSPYSNVTLEAIAGGIFELCLTYAVRDRVAQLSELVPTATYFALAPFIGRVPAGRVASGHRHA